MKRLHDALLMILVLTVQPTIAPHISIVGIRPDVVLLCLVFISISRGRAEGTLLGFAAGYFQDVYSVAPLGFNALLKCLVGYAAGTMHGEVATDTLGVRALIVFAATIAHDLAYHLFSPGTGIGEAVALLFRSGLPSAAYTALLALVTSVILSLLAGRALSLRARGWLRP